MYETVDYSNWDEPYVRYLDYKGTMTIYNGVMVGKYRHYIADSLAMAIDSILSKSDAMQKMAEEKAAESAGDVDQVSAL